METAMLQATLVQKEQVPSMRFPMHGLQSSATDLDLKKLRSKLWRATRLGNLEHNKVKLYFEDDAGLKMVHTTIWATGEHNVVLKSGVTIPINCIHDVIII